MSEESKDKNRQAHLGKTTKRKGTHLTEEHKLKISEANKGKVSPMKNRHHSEESKHKISISQTGKKMSEESKDKNRQAHLGRVPLNKGLTGLKYNKKES